MKKIILSLMVVLASFNLRAHPFHNFLLENSKAFDNAMTGGLTYEKERKAAPIVEELVERLKQHPAYLREFVEFTSYNTEASKQIVMYHRVEYIMMVMDRIDSLGKYKKFFEKIVADFALNDVRGSGIDLDLFLDVVKKGHFDYNLELLEAWIRTFSIPGLDRLGISKGVYKHLQKLVRSPDFDWSKVSLERLDYLPYTREVYLEKLMQKKDYSLAKKSTSWFFGSLYMTTPRKILNVKQTDFQTSRYVYESSEYRLQYPLLESNLNYIVEAFNNNKESRADVLKEFKYWFLSDHPYRGWDGDDRTIDLLTRLAEKNPPIEMFNDFVTRVISDGSSRTQGLAIDLIGKGYLLNNLENIDRAYRELVTNRPDYYGGNQAENLARRDAAIEKFFEDVRASVIKYGKYEGPSFDEYLNKLGFTKAMKPKKSSANSAFDGLDSRTRAGMELILSVIMEKQAEERRQSKVTNWSDYYRNEHSQYEGQYQKGLIQKCYEAFKNFAGKLKN